jgi:hypothetical protein
MVLAVVLGVGSVVAVVAFAVHIIRLSPDG